MVHSLHFYEARQAVFKHSETPVLRDLYENMELRFIDRLHSYILGDAMMADVMSLAIGEHRSGCMGIRTVQLFSSVAVKGTYRTTRHWCQLSQTT